MLVNLLKTQGDVYDYTLYFLLLTGVCLTCPAGRTCPSQGMNDTLPCPAGYYCTNGTSGNGAPCPIGPSLYI